MDDTVKKLLSWKDGWEEWEATGDEPAIPMGSDLDEFERLVKAPSQSFKDWMEEYVTMFWDGGMEELDRPQRKALLFGNSVSHLPNREREGNLLEDFWYGVSDFEADMIHRSKEHRVKYFETKVNLAKRAVSDANEILDYYIEMLERAKGQGHED